MIEWYPIAKEKGYRWFSWECGSIFDDMVEKLTPEIISELTILNNINVHINTDSGNHISVQEPTNSDSNTIMEYHELMKMIKKF